LLSPFIAVDFLIANRLSVRVCPSLHALTHARVPGIDCLLLLLLLLLLV